MTIEIPKGYETLGEALAAAVDQAAAGKGAGRHSYDGELFSEQLIFEIPRRLGACGSGFLLGQAVKKIYESVRLEPERARAEILGAINYLAAAWSRQGGGESVFASKASGNVCLDFAERVVSLMKEAGVREVSFASPGACIRADGTVTGLHFTTDGADGSGLKDAEALCRRIREVNPAVYPQEDYEAPLFPERTPVECRPPLESEWTPAFYIGVDPQGFHIVERGDGLRMHLSADAVRKPEDAGGAPFFYEGEQVEFRLRDGKWKPAGFLCMDGNFAIVVSEEGKKFRIPACDVRPAEKS